MLDAREAEIDAKAKIDQTDPALHGRLNAYRFWLTTQSGVLWKQYHDPENPPKESGGMTPPCPELPKGFASWDQFLQTRELQRLLERHVRHGGDASNASGMMAKYEAEFPALADLRSEEGHK